MYICSTNEIKSAYLPAFERWSLYKSIWMSHWEEFRRIYDRRFLSKYGELSDGKNLFPKVSVHLGKGKIYNSELKNYNGHCFIYNNEEGIPARTTLPPKKKDKDE